MSMEYKVDVKKLLEYHRILQMNNASIGSISEQERLEFHPEKSQYIIIGIRKTVNGEIITMNGQKMQKVKEYKYLGK